MFNILLHHKRHCVQCSSKFITFRIIIRHLLFNKVKGNDDIFINSLFARQYVCVSDVMRK